MSKAVEIHTEWLSTGPGLRAYYARPAVGGPYPIVVCFIEAFGVNESFQELAARLAGEGFCVAVPDIYHGATIAYDDMETVVAKLKALDEAQVITETTATLDVLGGRSECDAGRTMLLGFCLGGRLAFLANAELGERITAAACFYGGGIAPREDRFGRPPLLDRVGKMRAPIMLCYGAEDASIQPEEHGRIAAALSQAKKRYALHVFPNAGHAFFSSARASYAPAAADEAWRLVLEFFACHAAG